MERNIKIRDLRRKQFFMVDDEFLNGYVKHLGATATAVYLVLCRHASKEQVAFPSIKTIAEKLNLNEKTIRRKIKILEKWKIIQVIRERDEKGRWRNNVYILLDKTEWVKLPADTGVHTHTPTRVHIYSHQSPHKETHIRKQINKDNNKLLASQSDASNSLGKEINYFIGLFKAINPSYERLFANKTQRGAMERLLKKMGRENLEKIINTLPKIFGQPYAPRITTPLKLEEKLADLIAYLQQKKREKEDNGVAIL